MSFWGFGVINSLREDIKNTNHVWNEKNLSKLETSEYERQVIWTNWTYLVKQEKNNGIFKFENNF
jgi:hypothetical protein